MRYLDRYILKSFLVNYLLALCVLVGMFILFDLIVNIGDFAHGAAPSAVQTASISSWTVLRDMGDYYFFQFPVIFQTVSAIIPLLAAGFTMVRMTRHHELTAMMASGVSLYRVAAPIIIASLALSVINIINQEFIISQPYEIQKLLRRHDEVNAVASKSELLMFVKDTDGSLLSATEYYTGRDVPVAVTQVRAFTRTAGSFLEDRLKAGDVITARGFQNPANNGEFQIEELSEKRIFVKGKTLVAEALPATVVFSRPGPAPTGTAPGTAPAVVPVVVPVSVGETMAFTRTAGNFLDDGMSAQYVINTAGFHNAGNEGQFIVADVSPKHVTVEGKALVEEAASGAALNTGASMKNVFIVRRDDFGTPINHTRAASAHWEWCRLDPSRPDLQQTWVLRSVETVDDTGQNPDARPLAVAFRPTGLTPDQIELVLSKKAVDYLSSARVHELAKFSPDVNRPLLYKIMHIRFTQPLMNFIMLLIGIPFLLTREPGRLVVNMFYCTIISGIIFIATFVMFQMGGNQINPLLAAWLPVLIFGPFAAVMLDTIKT